jgi:hypothetical protein
MPIKRSNLNRWEQDEDRASRLQLESAGITTGAAEDPRPQPRRFTLEQIDSNFAAVYDLPPYEVGVVLPARLRVLTSVMFTDVAVFLPWDEWSLDLEEPVKNPYWDLMKDQGPSYKPTILNDLLVGKASPVRPCQPEGLILATGYGSVPAEYDEKKRVTLELRLWDEQDNEFTWNFSARVDRSFKRIYERSRPSRQEIEERIANSGGLYGSGKIEPGVQRDAPGNPRTEIAKLSVRASMHRRSIQ